MRFLLVLLIVLLTAEAQAQDRIVGLSRGTPAPFDGQLFSNATALRWGSLIKDYPELLAAEVAKQKGLCLADLAYKDELLRIEQDKNYTLIADLKTRLLAADTRNVKLKDELDNPPWYKGFWFGFGVGAISATAVIVVSRSAF